MSIGNVQVGVRIQHNMGASLRIVMTPQLHCIVGGKAIKQWPYALFMTHMQPCALECTGLFMVQL